MMRYKAIIVDDEPPAREVIIEYLDEIDWISVKQTFGNPQKALEYFRSNPVDLLFLDIQMPQMTGFELINELNSLPHIIFSTAYDEYAIRAFDINALDYLLKPYTKERFMKALKRVENTATGVVSQQKRIQALMKQVQEEKEYPDQLFVRSRDRIIPVEVDRILWIEAEGDYSRIYFEEGKVLCGLGLGKLLERLDPDRFARVHRSYAIALFALEELKPDGYGGFTATLNDDTEIKVSRKYSDQIKDFMI